MSVCVDACVFPIGACRYFVVEDTIMNTCQGIGVGHGVEGEGLVSGAVLETFWDMATAEMLSVLRTNCVSVFLH